MLTFEYPYLFLGLLLFILCAFTCKHKMSAIYMPHFLSMPLHVKSHRLQTILKWLGISMLFTALASPVIQSKEEQLRLSHSILLLLDVSESMHKELFDRTSMKSKFVLSKQLAASFIEKRKMDNIGVIIFGDFAYVATPLTYDFESASMIVQNLEEGIAGTKTAMYDALFLATRLLQKNSAKEKVVVLLTDGFNTTGNVPLEAALRALESEKIKVYAIGIGREGEFDEGVLSLLAQKSGGAFFKANSAKTLEEIYTKIDAMEQSLQSASGKYRYQYLYMYPLLAAFLALLGYGKLAFRQNICN
ncbi:vWA domain-containing protein [Sulfurospirillum oryzae]|uniref:vWA domain-containing protein n=1 Tax=Sulfurospirillum oryzae TaxID=2976535 RepID=UPI0021E73EE0|nr:VWA domain-containing protein [Sulfurospirillum oryzae]